MLLRSRERLNQVLLLLKPHFICNLSIYLYIYIHSANYKLRLECCVTEKREVHGLSLVDVYRRFGGTCAVLFVRKMKANICQAIVLFVIM
jgi:hypothetical protein